MAKKLNKAPKRHTWKRLMVAKNSFKFLQVPPLEKIKALLLFGLKLSAVRFHMNKP